MESTLLRDVMSCSLLEVQWRFEGTHCLHHQGHLSVAGIFLSFVLSEDGDSTILLNLDGLYRTTQVISHEAVLFETKIDSSPFTCNIRNTLPRNFYLRNPQSLKYLTREMFLLLWKQVQAFLRCGWLYAKHKEWRGICEHKLHTSCYTITYYYEIVFVYASVKVLSVQGKSTSYICSARRKLNTLIL